MKKLIIVLTAAYILLLICGAAYGTKASSSKEVQTAPGRSQAGKPEIQKGEQIDGDFKAQEGREKAGKNKEGNTEQNSVDKRKGISTIAASGQMQPIPSRGANRNSGSGFSRRTLLGSFVVTAYTAGVESTGKSPGHPAYGKTASGRHVAEGVTIAADWKLLPPGTVLYIEGIGLRVVEDSGSAVRGRKIDLYVDDLDTAIRWGRQARDVYVIQWGEKK